MRSTRVLVVGLSVLVGVSALVSWRVTAQPKKLSETFETYCTVCHGEDGKGQTEEGKKKKARDFTKKDWQSSVDDARIQKSITKGHDKMPAFEKKLSPEEIKALIPQVRAFAK